MPRVWAPLWPLTLFCGRRPSGLRVSKEPAGSRFEEWKERENAKELYFGERAVSDLRVLQAKHDQVLMQLQKKHEQVVKMQEEHASSMAVMTRMLNQLQPQGDWGSHAPEWQTQIMVDRQAEAAKLQTHGKKLVEKDRHIKRS